MEKIFFSLVNIFLEHGGKWSKRKQLPGEGLTAQNVRVQLAATNYLSLLPRLDLCETRRL